MPVAVIEMLTADETVALQTLTKVYAPERPLRFSSEARPVYRFRSVEAGELHASFRRHFGTTPTGFLRRVRLERAHQDLRAADPSSGDTVSAVAARWGFGHAARFTGCYREQYGVLPSRTLRA